MHFKPLSSPPKRYSGTLIKTILMMKFTVFFLLVACMQVSASGFSQVSLAEKNVPLRSVFKKIQKQTGFDFLYGSQFLQEAGNVSIDVSNVSLEHALELCFKGKPLAYTIIEKTIVVKPKPLVMADVTPVVELSEIISGKITDEQGMPLAGASVYVKGSSKATLTDAQGRFNLEVDNLEGTLVLSFVGRIQQELPLKGKKTFNVVLKSATEDLSDVVVIGYGSQKKETLSGAVVNIKSKDILTTKSTSVVSNIQGKIPGVHIRQQTAEPGTFNSLVSIRGFGTPLLVIDGVPRDGMSDFERLNPEDIESISVLKDAAAAIYGMNADNGVIIVTTKKGQKGLAKFNYSSFVGYKQPTSMPDMVDAYTYRTIRNEMDRNTKLSPTFSQTDLDKWKVGTEPGYIDYDWFKETLRDFTMQQQHNISASGGSEGVTYYTSLGILADDGILKSDIQKYRKYNFRTNVTFQMTKNLKAIVTLAGKVDNNRSPQGSYFWFFKPLIIADRAFSPFVPRTNNVTRIPPEFTNPYALSTEAISGYEKWSNVQYQTQVELQYDVPSVKGLKLGVVAAYDGNNNNWSNLARSYYQYDISTNAATLRGQNRYVNTMTQFGRAVVQASANYKTTIAKNHHIGATVVGEMRSLRSDIINASRFYADVYTWDILNQGSITNAQNGGDRIIQKYLSLLGRFNYDFKNKYLLEVAFREDGSYRYAPGKRWAMFPSASAGWRVSQENFMRNNLPWISNLKLRASYGMMGADQGNPFEYYLGYRYGNIDQGYIFNNGVLTAGMVPPGVVNENLTWINTRTANIGIDLSLWDGKLGIVADWFQKNRNGLLATKIQSVPNTFGASFPQENINKDMVKGFELMVSHKNKIGKLRYEVSANMTYARKYLVYSERAPYASSMQKWKDTWGTGGRVLGREWGYLYDGRYTDIRQYQSAPLMGGAAGNSMMLPGSFAVKDVDGNGIINGDDQLPEFWSGQYQGFAGNPPLQYGATINLAWGGFDMNMLFQGAALFSIFASPNDVWGYGRYPGMWEKYMDRWRLEDPNMNPYDPSAKWIPGEYPALRSNFNNTTDALTTDRWRLNASYVRLKSTEIGYTLAPQFAKRIKIDNLRVFVNGFNLFTFANPLAKNLDPEKEEGAYQADLTYPLMRSFNFGINLNF
jgi:TonB-linked SusC/RagA family outer membrane protein